MFSGNMTGDHLFSGNVTGRCQIVATFVASAQLCPGHVSWSENIGFISV